MSDLHKIKIYESKGARGVIIEIDGFRIQGLRGYQTERNWNEPKILKLELVVDEIEIVNRSDG